MQQTATKNKVHLNKAEVKLLQVRIMFVCVLCVCVCVCECVCQRDDARLHEWSMHVGAEDPQLSGCLRNI